jgi:NAD(P)-dependent dehydrogenase (short-subunit alcohol dehydrogenase family)
MKLKPIEEQVVVIVGATSGIGRASALEFARRGAKVVISGRSQSALDSLAQEILGAGGQAVTALADVSEYEQVKQVAERAVDAFGRIDTWVHLAAVSIYASFEDTKPEEFKRLIEVNLLGQVHGAMAALPYLKREGRGALIHISSVESRTGLPYNSAYAASKKAITGFLDVLRIELKHEGLPISVTNVLPSSINTPLFDKALTRLGVKPAPVPPIYPPEVAVTAIVYAAEHPTREIFAGGGGKALGLLQRVSPRAADAIVRRISFKAQRTDQPKSESAPSNLYQHVAGFDRVEGAFTAKTRPSLFTWLRTRPLVAWVALAAAMVGGVLLTRPASKARKSRNYIRQLQKTARSILVRKPTLAARIKGVPKQVLEKVTGLSAFS